MYPIPANATRIRYLESTGTQYIDTGIYYATPIEFQADVSVTQIDGTNCVFGCSTVMNRFWLGISQAGKVDLGMGGGIASPSLAQSIVLGQRYLFRYQLAYRRTIWQDGTSLWTGDLQPAPSNVSIWAFGSRRGPSDSEAYQRSGDGWKGRIYALKIMQGSGYPIVRDFVPVRVGSVGYLFDRVSGQLFGNAADNNAGFPAECCGPDTFSQGVVPTRMMAMGVRKKVTYPWDYRVAYFQSDGTATGFILPLPQDINTAIVNTTDCREAITQSLVYGRIVVSAPSSAETGDKKLCGCLGEIGACRYSTKWRPAGIAAWPPQPTATEVPFYADEPTLFEWEPGYSTVSVPGRGKSKKSAYTASRICLSGNDARFSICFWYPSASAPSGTRFYDARISFSHPTYGFGWDVVPCVKDNIPYICDRLTGTLYQKTGSGTIILGPQVADDYDVITNP